MGHSAVKTWERRHLVHSNQVQNPACFSLSNHSYPHSTGDRYIQYYMNDHFSIDFFQMNFDMDLFLIMWAKEQKKRNPMWDLISCCDVHQHKEGDYSLENAMSHKRLHIKTAVNPAWRLPKVNLEMRHETSHWCNPVWTPLWRILHFFIFPQHAISTTAILDSTEAALLNSASSKIHKKHDLCHYKSACLLTCMQWGMVSTFYVVPSRNWIQLQGCTVSTFFCLGQ